MSEATATYPTEATALPLVTARGETTIAPVVAEKIARRAAEEVDGVSGAVKGGLNRLLPWTTDARVPAAAEADVIDERVHVSLSVGVQYPHPVSEVVHRVRQNVFDRVVSLTGLTVSSVDVTVVGLPHEGRRSKRVI